MTENTTTLWVDLNGERLRCDPSQTLLQLMNEAGISTRQPCRNGVCNQCRCRLLRGEITYHHRKPHGLWQKQIDEGFILPCIAHACTDLVLEPPVLKPD